MFLYETHLHTYQGSGCGRSSGKEHAQYYKELGYTGIVVTDHFFGGNTGPDREQPWRDYVEEFCSGYEDAKAEGDRIGLDVFFGWEQGMKHDTNGLRFLPDGTQVAEPENHDDEYLIYGPDKAWLLAHEEIRDCSRARQLQLIHEAGGCVVQAHPFRWRGYMKRVRLALGYCDAVEAANAGNFPLSDLYAWNYAKEYGLPVTAGSDNHDSSQTDKVRYAVGTQERVSDIRQLAQMIRAGQVTPVFPHERLTGDMTDQFIPESYWVDGQENLRPTGRVWDAKPEF